MKVSELIKELEHVIAAQGDIDVCLQDDGLSGAIAQHESIFVVPEEYTTDGDSSEYICNIRWWPY